MKSRTTFLIAILLLSLPSVLRAEDFGFNGTLGGW